MTNASIIDDYYRWLINIVKGDSISEHAQNKLFSIMNDIVYEWEFAGDENRALAGRELRKYYLYEIGEDVIRVLYGTMDEYLLNDILDEAWDTYDTCTSLECLIGIAKEWEDELAFDAIYGDRTPHWFWDHMMYNLDLKSNQLSIATIQSSIHAWINREYDSDGNHNIFTIPNFEGDMRDIEIWWQLCAYVNYLESEDYEHVCGNRRV